MSAAAGVIPRNPRKNPDFTGNSAHMDLLKTQTTTALTALGGRAHWLVVAEKIWDTCGEVHIKPLALTWNYDLKWAATALRNEGILKNRQDTAGQGMWELV